MKDAKSNPARGRAVRSAAKPAQPAVIAAPASALPKPAPAPSVAAKPIAPPPPAPVPPVAAKPASAPLPEVKVASPAPKPEPKPAPAPAKAETPAPAALPKAVVEAAPEPAVAAMAAPAPLAPLAPLAPEAVRAASAPAVEGARLFYAQAHDAGETLRQALSDSAAAATRGMVELNGQMVDLLRAQGDATLALWRATLSAGSLSEAIRVQTSGARQAYEASVERWRAIAETANRALDESARPIRSAFANDAR